MTDSTPPPGSPMPPQPAGPAPQNGLGTAALVMGILQFICLGPIASVLAIIFGRIGMSKAKQGEATNGGVAKAGFWLGIAGLILTVVGIIIAVFAIGFGVKAANEAVDPGKNSHTGLADGNYTMNPNTSVFLNDRCAFGGPAVNTDSQQASGERVTVVGAGSAQCGVGMDTPNVVTFTVTGGFATIVDVG
jgi:hypothetical protein